MKITENAITGITAIFTNKLRSLLTTLGIVIGVAAVVGTIAVGEGAKTLVMGEVEKVGGRTLFMVQRQWYIKKDGKWMVNPSREFLTREDALAIERECPSVRDVTPEIMDNVKASVGREARQYTVEATVPTFRESQNWLLDFGRFLSDDDMSNWEKVCDFCTEYIYRIWGK